MVLVVFKFWFVESGGGIPPYPLPTGKGHSTLEVVCNHDCHCRPLKEVSFWHWRSRGCSGQVLLKLSDQISKIWSFFTYFDENAYKVLSLTINVAFWLEILKNVGLMCHKWGQGIGIRYIKCVQLKGEGHPNPNKYVLCAISKLSTLYWNMHPRVNSLRNSKLAVKF